MLRIPVSPYPKITVQSQTDKDFPLHGLDTFQGRESNWQGIIVPTIDTAACCVQHFLLVLVISALDIEPQRSPKIHASFPTPIALPARGRCRAAATRGAGHFTYCRVGGLVLGCQLFG
jgi:hypothetical protein